MKNLFFFTLIILCNSTFSQTKSIEFDKREKYEAINDYLQTIIKDKNQEIIIVEDKISPNEILRIFKGNIIKDHLGKFVEQDGGVEKPLFNEKYFLTMKKKYYDNSPPLRRNNFTVLFWKKEDFKHNKITLENFEDVFLKLQKGLYFEKPEIQILALSEPIYYKNKDYLVIGILPAKTRSVGFSTSYIVVMKKINKRWVIVNKTIDYIMD